MLDFISRTCPEGGEFVSSSDDGARRIVFSPSVFSVPPEKPDLSLVSVMMGCRQKDTLVPTAQTFNDYLDALYLSEDTIIDAITNFDPKDNVSEMMAEYFGTGSPDWRIAHAEIWNRHVLHHGGGQPSQLG